jgi:predicted nuclease of predicted toxin-antitoxin system
MRFLLDANMPRSATVLFASRGHEAVHVGETDLKDAADQRIAERGHAERRVVVTRDLDFADVRRYPPEESPGYLVLRVPDTWIATEINELLSRFLALSDLVGQIPGHLVILDPRRIRFRPALKLEAESDE